MTAEQIDDTLNWMPEVSAVDLVIRNFAQAVAIAAEVKGEVNMSLPIVLEEPKDAVCWTIACAAGWYALAVHSLSLIARDTDKPISYHEGKTFLARDLEFQSHNPRAATSWGALALWAARNPSVWGNADGAFMFCASEAYRSSFWNPDFEEPITVKVIHDHWKYVVRPNLIKHYEEVTK